MCSTSLWRGGIAALDSELAQLLLYVGRHRVDVSGGHAGLDRRVHRFTARAEELPLLLEAPRPAPQRGRESVEDRRDLIHGVAEYVAWYMEVGE